MPRSGWEYLEDSPGIEAEEIGVLGESRQRLVRKAIRRVIRLLVISTCGAVVAWLAFMASPVHIWVVESDSVSVSSVEMSGAGCSLGTVFQSRVGIAGCVATGDGILMIEVHDRSGASCSGATFCDDHGTIDVLAVRMCALPIRRWRFPSGWDSPDGIPLEAPPP
jgi:hypothetical protein